MPLQAWTWGCGSLIAKIAVVGSDCVLASIPWGRRKGRDRDKETERRDIEEVPSCFWPLAPFRSEKELMRKVLHSSS
jgi:hypothetical protein